MINFICLFAIILELLATVLVLKKLIEFDKKTVDLSNRVVIAGTLALDINNKTNSTIKQINKIVSIVTNKKLWIFVTILKKAVGFIQIFILIRTIGLNKGLSVNLRSIKKLIVMELFKKTFWYFCKYL